MYPYHINIKKKNFKVNKKISLIAKYVEIIDNKNFT